MANNNTQVGHKKMLPRIVFCQDHGVVSTPVHADKIEYFALNVYSLDIGNE